MKKEKQAAARETLFVALGAFIDAHLAKAWDQLGVRALREWRNMALKMGANAKVEERLKALKQLTNLPKLVQAFLTSWDKSLRPGKVAPGHERLHGPRSKTNTTSCSVS